MPLGITGHAGLRSLRIYHSFDSRVTRFRERGTLNCVTCESRPKLQSNHTRQFLSYYNFGSQVTSLGERGTLGDVNCEPHSINVGAGVICAEQPQHSHHIFPFSELSVGESEIIEKNRTRPPKARAIADTLRTCPSRLTQDHTASIRP